ncbi:hypothetical protein HAX54_012195 [Datura stramonium]|uniref:Uncharacterized protein n=1 Tax=Datura stramonium TaxID=4076 RepID=A0ABS8Y508_DATST|nr:hypothetical protein [Datura stramonium]
MMPQPRRKKWTEAEERTLIDKYGEMVCEGTLAKMKTREKKYRPIALHVNSVHHVCDPITYPWQWTWKDVSTKVQNMRHQYTLVKQKIKKPNSAEESGAGEEFDWMEGLTHWSNFLRYKEVFGDINTLVFNCSDSMAVVGDGNENGGGFDGSGNSMGIDQFGHLGHAGDGDFMGGINGVDHGVTGMEFDYDGEGEENFNGSIRRSSHLKEDADDGFVYEDIEPTGSDTRKKKKILKGVEMPQPRRKKWTEAEERTLIDKYGEMVCDGTLAKMKTREKKYRPIALHVNSVHHVRDPITYPWQWTWKDVSTKVQNMRHQYTLVKQKIKKPSSTEESGAGEEFDWMEGLTHWSNFMRYKEVFGDVNTLVFNCSDSMVVVGDGNENGGGFDGSGNSMGIDQFGHLGHAGDGDFTGGINGVDHDVTGMEFDYDGEEEENFNGSIRRNGHLKEDAEDGFVYEDVEPTGSDTRKKKKILKGVEKRVWGFLATQLSHLKEMEARFEQREAERERERQRREHLRIELEQERERKWEEREREREEREKTREKLQRQRIQEWEAMKKESEERERRRREEQLIFEREREERMHKRIDETLSQHRAEMSQIQTRILHEQQNLTSQLLGIFSQWTGHPTGLSDHTGASNHYLSQMMQNLHHVNGMVHGDARVEEDAQEDQFIVDG